MIQRARLLCLALVAAWMVGCDTTDRTPQVVEPLPAFSFPDLQGTEQDSSQWQNKVLVIHLWDTFCEPCKREIPLYTEQQQRLASAGVQFIGIAVDRPHLVQDYVDVYDISYPVLLGGPRALELSFSMGNRFQGLPFTAIYDRSGKRQFAHTGEVTAEMLAKALKALQ